MGLELDVERNRSVRGEATISTDRSPVSVLVVPADEERVVARATAEVVATLPLAWV
jgi:acetate kinase